MREYISLPETKGTVEMLSHSYMDTEEILPVHHNYSNASGTPGHSKNHGAIRDCVENYETELLKEARRFVIVSRIDGGSLSKISPFAIERVFNKFGEVRDIFRRKDGKLMIEAEDFMHAQKLTTITNIEDHDVTVEFSAKMNSCKAVVRDEDMIHWDMDELLTNLAPQGVIDIKNIKSRRRNPKDQSGKRDADNRAEWYPTPTFIITFDLPERPQFLKIGYTRLETRDYIPDPIRCFQCQQFGHFRTSCKNVAVCVRCSETEHRPEPCKRGIKCSNCGGPHFASWRICPIYKEEYNIQKLCVQYRVPYQSAKAIFKDQHKKRFTMAETISRGHKIDIGSAEPKSSCSQCGCDCEKRRTQTMAVTSTNIMQNNFSPDTPLPMNPPDGGISSCEGTALDVSPLNSLQDFTRKESELVVPLGDVTQDYELDKKGTEDTTEVEAPAPLPKRKNKTSPHESSFGSEKDSTQKRSKNSKKKDKSSKGTVPPAKKSKSEQREKESPHGTEMLTSEEKEEEDNPSTYIDCHNNIDLK